MSARPTKSRSTRRRSAPRRIPSGLCQELRFPVVLIVCDDPTCTIHPRVLRGYEAPGDPSSEKANTAGHGHGGGALEESC